MRKQPIFLFIASFVFCSWSEASVKTYHYNNTKFSVEVPKDWDDSFDTKEVPGRWGAMLIVQGPDNDEETRSSVMISDTFLVDKQNKLEALDKDPKFFKEELESWLKERDGRLINYGETQVKKDFNGIKEAFYFSSRYQISSGKFLEKTAYIRCKNAHVYHIKGIILDKYENEQGKDFDSIFGEFKCL